MIVFVFNRKIKAKELEAVQQEKQLKIVKAVLNDIISKIESENEANENDYNSVIQNEKNDVIVPEPPTEEIRPNEVDTMELDEKQDSGPESERESEKSDEESSIKIIDDKKLETSENFAKIEDVKESIESSQANYFTVTEKPITQQEQGAAETTPLPADLGEFRQYNEKLPDNYYVTLDDLKNMQQVCWFIKFL